MTDLPFKLKLNKFMKRNLNEDSSSERFHFVRLSALNDEFGEGPYSPIIELRKIDRIFEAPINIDYKNVNAKNLTLKWSYDMDLLRLIEKQINFQQNIIEFESFQIINSNQLSGQDQALFKNLYFELYLAKKVSNITRKSRRLVKPFRTISAYKLLLNDNLVTKLKRTKRQLSNENELITFEYNLTNLWPNTKYSFELSARLFNLESYLSRSIKITTMSKFFNSISIINNILIIFTFFL